MERIIVTGGSGFIGSHLCETLLHENYNVACIDNLLTGSVSNIAHLKKNPNFEFINKSIEGLQKIDGKVDAIFNLASPASPIDYQLLPLETLRANSLGTSCMLEIARETGASFLQASTSEVYGDPKISPQAENYFGNVNPNGKRSCYDEGKRFSESLCMTYLRQFDLDVRIVRIFNTYGPRMRRNDGRVIPNFITQSLEGRPITIYGKGNQTRSFCYVSDLVFGLLSAMNCNGTKGEVINLGNPTELTISEVAKKIIVMCNSKSKIEFHPLPEDDPTSRKPDIAKAKKLLKWEPKIGLEKGLASTIDYFKH